MGRGPARLEAPASQRSATWILLATATLAVVLAGLRLYHGVSFATPALQMTTGLEEEALFSIWSTANGQETYRDILDVPFSHSYFNWLFYVTYAAVVRIALAGHPGADLWIPTIAHVTTLLAGVAGAIVFARFMRRELPGTVSMGTPITISAAALAFFGPLAGFWVFAARPDIASLALEVSAFVYGARYFRRGENQDLWLAVALSLAGWSFKQTCIVVFASLVIALLMRRQWRYSALACAAMTACASLPFLVYGEKYFVNAYLIQTATPFLLGHGLENLRVSILKAPVIPCAVAALCAAFSFEGRRMLRNATAFELVAFTISLLFAVVTGAKVGASQNYFLLANCLALWWLVKVQYLSEPGASIAHRATRGLFVVAMALQAVSAGAILSGRAGRIDISADSEYLRNLRQSLPAYATPILILTRSGNLPWIQPTPPHFLFGYLYDAPMLRSMGYRANGLEGLVESGYIKTLVVPKLYPPDLALRVPEGMTLVRESESFRYFSRP